MRFAIAALLLVGCHDGPSDTDCERAKSWFAGFAEREMVTKVDGDPPDAKLADIEQTERGIETMKLGFMQVCKDLGREFKAECFRYPTWREPKCDALLQRFRDLER